MRPCLTLLGAEIVGGLPDDIFHLATITEFIHTSSLIFDDLPCMDNSPKRRGRDSLHMVYGEGLAILVAIGLLNASYDLVYFDLNFPVDTILNIQAEIVESIGANGMVGGQSIDIAFSRSTNPKSDDHTQQEKLKNLKTSALIKLSLLMGAIAAKASDKELQSLSEFAYLMGNAYQMRDDFIDQEEDKQKPENIINFKEHLSEIVEESKSILISNYVDNRARSCLLDFADVIDRLENIEKT